ncbi:MAG TPA: hypothetical protein VF118_00685 [Gemmatimonadaceae bacterium]
MDSVTALLRDIRIQHWTSFVEFLSSLVLAILIPVLWLRFARKRRLWQRIALGTAGCATILIYGAVAWVAAVCWDGGVYMSAKSNLTRAYGAPIVNALARYHAATGHYPIALQELVPVYISTPTLHAIESSPLGYPFEYTRDGTAYTLRARYAGPGMNECEIRPGQDWKCRGYF